MSGPIPLVQVQVSEQAKARVRSVLDSGRLAQGPVVAELEEAFAAASQAKHCVAVANGTLALQAALTALDIQPGDEVITTPFTFIATVNAALAAGARVRFADIRDDYTINPDSVAALVNERTRLILPVHLFGLAADLPALAKIAEPQGIPILEDAAQAHGARLPDGRVVGAVGAAGCFSLYATKNLSAGEGGLITTNDDALADRLRTLRNQGMRARYDYVGWGTNYRMTDLHAAVVLDDARRLTEINATRNRNAHQLLEGLAGIDGLELPVVPTGSGHVWHQFTVRITPDAPVTRDALMKALGDRGIGSDVFYPAALPDVPHLRAHPLVADDPIPLTRRIVQEVVSLPVGHHLSNEQVASVVAVVREVLHHG